MDWSPFAMITSPAILFIYSAITLYLALCLMLGFKVTHAYAANSDWWGYRCCCCLPKWAIVLLFAVALMFVFAIIVVPVALCFFAWVFVVEKIHYLCSRRRRGGGGNDLEAGGGNVINDAASWTTIDTPTLPIHRDDRHDLNPQTNECATESYPDRPAPVYFQGRFHEDM
ncbi:hypothetical protein F4805DRAFT_457270 [Annulohypoxylon moriforme]|nr:hypothetical protein F4805DRAFT_457270 [Annulohypoxylon moriforme]